MRDPELLRLLHPILNSVYNTCQPPAEFLLNRIVALPKKGDLSQYGSYRGISLMSCAAKLFNRVLLNRIKDPIERLLRPNQNGFRQGRSTLEPILAIRRLIEALSAKRDASLCAVFVDFTKAFDSVHRERMFTILGLYGIPPKIVNAIRCIYTGSKSFVSTPDGDTEAFSVNTGVLQGDTLAPFLFIIIVDYVLRESMQRKELGVELRRRQGSRRPAQYLTDLDFADDIALLSHTMANAQTLLQHLESAASTVGLFINRSKTKALAIGEHKNIGAIALSSGPIETVADFCYLGSWIRTSNKDLTARKAQAWAAADKLRRIWKAPQLSRELKVRLFRATVETVLLYGAQCWSLTTAQTRSLDGTYTRLLRKALNVHFSAHMTNATLYGTIPRLSATLRQRRLQFAGHCYRRFDQPVHFAMFYNPAGVFRRGGHVQLNFVKQLIRDTGMCESELSSAMTNREAWRAVCAQYGSANEVRRT